MTVNRGYGGALRSGFEASRHELSAFTDGDRQFRIEDIAAPHRAPRASDRPDVVVGYRIKRADPLIRILYARTYKLANRIFYGLGCATWTAPASCSAARRSRASGWSPAGHSSRQSCGRDRRAGRRSPRSAPALRAHRRLADGRPAVGHRAGCQGLLDAAPAPVGERDRARRRGRPILAASRTRWPRRHGIAAVRLEAVHEVAEDVELRGSKLSPVAQRARGKLLLRVPGHPAGGRLLLALVIVVLVIVRQGGCLSSTCADA